jgi:phage tail-like protein
LTVAGLSDVSLGEVTTQSIDYREGNEPGHVRKLPGLTKFGSVTLKRGVTTSLELFQWHRQVAAGAGSFRRSVAIVVLDEAGADAARFVVTDAWPVKFVAGALNAKGNDVLIEALELANEGIERVQ